MKKVRSNSKWARLPPAQREAVEGWLFVDKLGYGEAVARARKEFGIEASKTSLFRYYHHRSLELMHEEDAELNQAGKTIGTTALPVNEWRMVALKVVGTRLVRLAAREPENIRGLERLTRLLLDNAGCEVKERRVTLEERRDELAEDQRSEENRQRTERRERMQALWQGMVAKANEEDAAAAEKEAAHQPISTGGGNREIS